MTVATRHPAPHVDTKAHPRPPGPDPAPFTPIVRPMRDDELIWAIHSMGNGWKDAPGNRSRTWGDYKASATGVQVVRDAICRPDCTRLAVDGPVEGRAVGWLVLSRRPGYDAVHWVYVAKQFRRARSRGLAPFGAMTGLLGHVVLKRSVVYTFEAACDPRLPRLPPRENQDARLGRNDVWLADHLRDRGHVVSYEPYAEWSR